MQSVLVMFRPDGERRSFSMTRDMTVIGRREDCDLRIPLGDVSRKHCRVVREGEILKIEDLGSSNGTYLNGQRVQEALLSPGDSIQVGPVVFVLQIDGEPADDELSPVVMQTAAATTGGVDDSAALEALEDAGPALDDADELEEVSEEVDAPAASGGPVDEDEEALEPLTELDPLEPDLADDDSKAKS
jgi:predicted component of type VI protein secretion system